jgi:hypothetical protein
LASPCVDVVDGKLSVPITRDGIAKLTSLDGEFLSNPAAKPSLHFSKTQRNAI